MLTFIVGTAIDESFENLHREGEINVGLLEATQSLNRPVMSITSSRINGLEVRFRIDKHSSYVLQGC